MVSLRPLALPWQPLPAEPVTLESYAGHWATWVSGMWRGVDACPCFRAGETQMALSAVALVPRAYFAMPSHLLEAPAALALLGGCSTGEVVAFLWRRSEELSPSEAAEWRVQTLLGEASELEAPMPLPSDGFTCVMRLRQHQARCRKHRNPKMQ